MEYIKTYKKGFIIGAVIIAVLVIIGFGYKFKKNTTKDVPVEDNSSLLSIFETPKTEKTFPKKSVVKSENLTYTEAYMKYHDGRMIQFDNNCQSRPNNIVLKNGSKLMLDNRGSNSENIKIGDNAYSIDAYGFKIITVNAPKIPTTYSIDCKFAQNVTTLIVE